MGQAQGGKQIHPHDPHRIEEKEDPQKKAPLPHPGEHGAGGIELLSGDQEQSEPHHDNTSEMQEIVYIELEPGELVPEQEIQDGDQIQDKAQLIE